LSGTHLSLDRAVRALTIPTLLVRGGMSDVVTQKIADEFALLSPGRCVTEVRGAGHMVAGDRNDRLLSSQRRRPSGEGVGGAGHGGCPPA
jgi:pimeloyl-ACP methyl ester carboxylesterase